MDEKFILRVNTSEKERNYVKFYNRIITDYFDIDMKLISNVTEILGSRSLLSGNEFDDHPEINQFAQLLFFGVHDTCSALRNFNESAEKYPGIINSFISKSRIRLCCMGSKSLFATLGICSVIDEAIKELGFLDADPTEIQVFLIEANSKYKRLCRYIVDAANGEYENVKLTLHYLQEDLQEAFSERVKLSVSKSHMVIMVKFISQFSSPKTVRRIIKMTLGDMKKDATLFYMDYENEELGKNVKDIMSIKDSFSIIKSSKEQYVLREKTKCLLNDFLYQCLFPFRWKFCFPYLISSVFIKTPNIKVRPQNLAETSNTLEEQIPEDKNKKPRKRRNSTKSSNTLRNSKNKFRLVGKFATIDMEKKNKDDTHRQEMKEASVSRYSHFDDD